ncbi:hypothetical protein FLL45_06680 [Aliikangiella marina]|uniref:NAD(P)-dependent oxidoreductase n=1 Tax=Aliikangiella marina TaxID=1712262 RepID=A0A545TBN7_9GAMM|nr:hypothetical protein [Aliikangiella marina]TQV74643.1 hypothetical protein FLL45_06680 [Aliikangiella marina]
MEPVNANQSPSIVICGQGRIGGSLIDILQSQNIDYLSARLDVASGLCTRQQNDPQLPHEIDLLVVCISARHRGGGKSSWQWNNIFNGLIKQIDAGEISVTSLVMVSSTRVYEGYDCGLIKASSETRALSAQGEGLVAAESALINSPINTLILRCSGLYGALYPVYQPILLSGKDKPRFGVDADKVVERLFLVVKQVLTHQFKPGIELMTNGNLYFKGEVLTWPRDKKHIENLARTHRVLINSSTVGK